MFIPSEDDLNKWKKYTYLKNSSPQLEKELIDWEERDNVDFKYRPRFSPIYSRENVDEMILELENFDMNFVEPKNYTINTEEDGE
jgi:hypothetical protein